MRAFLFATPPAADMSKSVLPTRAIRLGRRAKVVLLVTTLAAVAAAIVLGAVLLTGCSSGSSRRSSGSPAWIQDIEYLTQHLEKQRIDGFAPATRADFLRKAKALEAKTPSLNDAKMQVGIMQLVASIGDPHTAAGATELLAGSYPIGLGWFPDGVYVTKAADWERRLLGKRLVAIDGHPTTKVWSAVSTVVAHENSAWLHALVPSYFGNGHLLNALGISAATDHARWTFAGADGKQTTVTLLAKRYPHGVLLPPWTLKGSAEPLAYRHQDMPYWWERIDGGRTLYLAYNRCEGRQAFTALTSRIAASLRREPAEKVIIDLRWNGGGDSSVFDPMLNLLKADGRLNRHGHLYALIGRVTFSSGEMNADSMHTDTAVVLVGEATGGTPNTLGEIASFTLPNSGMVIYYSTKYFLEDLALGKAPSLEPDVAIEPTIADYLTGRDPVLDYARRVRVTG